jgi:hypothetical protein
MHLQRILSKSLELILLKVNYRISVVMNKY